MAHIKRCQPPCGPRLAALLASPALGHLGSKTSLGRTSNESHLSYSLNTLKGFYAGLYR